MKQYLFSNITLLSLLVFLGSFVSVYLIIPRIIWVVKSRDLSDFPNERSTHEIATPSMGGFSFFLTLVLVSFFIKDLDVDNIGMNFIAAITIILTIGLKDDLVISTPKAKLFGESLAISFLLFCKCMQVSSFNGFIGFYEIPIELFHVLIITTLLTIINSYNLIDGIDGLAASIGLASFSLFAIIFFITDMHFYFLKCLGLVGMLLAYLRYNFSSNKKIFMGDTGALIIGFCVAFFTLKFIAMDMSLYAQMPFYSENKLIIIASIILIPLFDTFRVFGVRLLNDKNPMYPDRNHLHHILVDYGHSHFKISALLSVISFIIGVLFMFLSLFLNSFKMLIILAFVFILFLICIFKLKKNLKKINIQMETSKR